MTNNKKIILEEIKKAMQKTKINNDKVASAYEIVQIIRQINNEYEHTKHFYDKKLNNIINSKYQKGTQIDINNFDCNNKTLRISFYDGICGRIINIKFDNGKIVVVSSEYNNAKQLISTVEDILFKLYEKLIEFNDFNREYVYKIKTINSNFLIDISSFGLNLFLESDEEKKNRFEISAYSYNNRYIYSHNYTNIEDYLFGQEDELFKRINVSLEDCPSWCQNRFLESKSKQKTKKVDNKVLRRILKFDK